MSFIRQPPLIDFSEDEEIYIIDEKPLDDEDLKRKNEQDDRLVPRANIRSCLDISPTATCQISRLTELGPDFLLNLSAPVAVDDDEVVPSVQDEEVRTLRLSRNRKSVEKYEPAPFIISKPKKRSKRLSSGSDCRPPKLALKSRPKPVAALVKRAKVVEEQAAETFDLIRGETSECFIQRVMQEVVDKETGKTGFLAFWYQYPYYECSLQRADEIGEDCFLMREFREKERGYEAIRRQLSKEIRAGKYNRLEDKIVPDMESIFVRRTLPPVLNAYPDKKYEHWLEMLLNGHRRYIPQLGYWCIKYVEMEWMNILDPNLKFFTAPLYVEHWYANEASLKFGAPKFKFLTRNLWTPGAVKTAQIVAEKRRETLGVMCQCTLTDLCVSCEASIGGLNHVITDNGTLVERPRRSAGKDEKRFSPYIYGCDLNHCVCENTNCIMRILEAGRKYPLVIFYEPLVNGYGVRALTDIPADVFVSEYVGEVKPVGDLHLNTYVFDMSDSTYLSIDAAEYGNESRFFSHSCEPNMCAVPVLSMMFGKFFNRIGLFTIKNVKAGEELTFDYRPNGLPPNIQRRKCMCGTKNCRNFF